MKAFIKRLINRILCWIGGDGFTNEYFPFHLLIKHLFIQKILRINAHVPWPVHPTSTIADVNNIVRGSRCPGLSLGCYIQAKNGIIFGENVWIGPGVGIISANHDMQNFSQHIPTKPLKIGNNCWIGMNAVILPGVELGEHVIVGAGAVVTESFGSNLVIAGNPARIIKGIPPYGGTDNPQQTAVGNYATENFF